jgi:hypothetical protein
MMVLVSTIIISIAPLSMRNMDRNRDKGISQVLGEQDHQYDSPSINNNNKYLHYH